MGASEDDMKGASTLTVSRAPRSAVRKNEAVLNAMPPTHRGRSWRQNADLVTREASHLPRVSGLAAPRVRSARGRGPGCRVCAAPSRAEGAFAPAAYHDGEVPTMVKAIVAQDRALAALR